MALDEVVAALTSTPMRDYDDLAARAASPPPSGPGAYAWWQRPGSLPSITGTPHDSADLELLYLGIGPNGPASKSDLRKRLAKHHRAAIGSSTFRFTLAAFLWESKGWRPYWTDRVCLPKEQLEALAQWQRGHLSVQWVALEKPWDVEAELIRAMRPPLNLDHNAEHPMFPLVEDARRTFRDAARSRPGPGPIA